ncbi:MAG: 16S rRNA (adenine(1518)-N(6)/adenine(1519)-N(6))-dimethyltransferase RsmA [Synergistaceae bacterium]|nr:16S rRNA (adenine(1518)-N(6)/adenine(1519)-N(6))-dimethyltransferase RsmA [Synergistaceae bacterium]
MNKLHSPAFIAESIGKHGFKISKSLGQNFLADGNITEKIAGAAQIEKDNLVIEIGAGLGALTAAAAERAAWVVAVEIDQNLIPLLQDNLKDYDNVEILCADILKENIRGIIENGAKKSGLNPASALIIGNLPYYITTPVIMKILEEKTAAKTLTFMVQKEVADRIGAKPGTKAYGAITAVINYYCTVSYISDVPRSVFFPKPNVDSAVIQLSVRESPPVALNDETLFFACIKAGFGQRRKMLINSLSGVNGLGRQEIQSALANAGIDHERRAETLSIIEFAALANCIQHAAVKTT